MEDQIYDLLWGTEDQVEEFLYTTQSEQEELVKELEKSKKEQELVEVLIVELLQTKMRQNLDWTAREYNPHI